MSPYVGVVGASDPSESQVDLARAVGRLLAANGAVLVCGGLGGVMEAACQGAQEIGGITVGLLPMDDRSQANPFLTVAITTGLGEIRNTLIVRAVDAIIGIGCGWGTLSELSFARRAGLPVFVLDSWAIVRSVSGEEEELGHLVKDPQDAVTQALRSLRQDEQ